MAKKEPAETDLEDVRNFLKDKDIKELIKDWKEYSEKKIPMEIEGRRIRATIILVLIIVVGILTWQGTISTQLTAAVYGGLVTAIMTGKL
jgi:hypothetical protein